MQLTFRWIKARVMIYATEDKERVTEMFSELVGTDEYKEDLVEGELGNITVILEATLTKQKEFDRLFGKFELENVEWILTEIEDRINDECTFFLRLDKQEAMSASYVIGRGGDVISLTCKVASYPAKRELAIDNLREYLNSLNRSPQELP